MEKPSFGLGVQLVQNFINLMRGLSAEEEDRLNRNFDLVRAVALGELTHLVLTFETWKTITPLPLTSEQISFNLVCAKVSELYFTEMPTTEELWKRIGEIGTLCPAEVGPHLRLQYKDQPNGEILWVPVKPIAVSGDRTLNAFTISHIKRYGCDEDWLESCFVYPNHCWSLEAKVVFSHREQ